MRTFWLAMFLLFTSVFAGCQMGDRTKDETGVRDTEVERTRFQTDNERATPQNRRDQDNQFGTENRRDNRENRSMDDRRDNQSYDVHREAADRIVKEIDHIDQAYVITSNRNAYVAAVLDEDDGKGTGKDKGRNDRTDRQGTSDRFEDDGEELTDEVKKEIKDIVRSVDRNIENVYVSTNPDFTDLTNNYINDFNEGKPVRGMFDQIGQMIERLFPQNR